MKNISFKRLIRILPDIHCRIKNQIRPNQLEPRRCSQLRSLKPRTKGDAWRSEFESSAFDEIMNYNFIPLFIEFF